MDYWRAAEERGDPLLRRMAKLPALTPTHQHGLWAWPAFFTRPVEEWTAADHREARRLLGEDGVATQTASGAYLGYRLGIADGGTWQYFIAGD